MEAMLDVGDSGHNFEFRSMRRFCLDVAWAEKLVSPNTAKLETVISTQFDSLRSQLRNSCIVCSRMYPTVLRSNAFGPQRVDFGFFRKFSATHLW